MISDVDECEIEEMGVHCDLGCINTIGSYRCAEEEDVASFSDELEVTCEAGLKPDGQGGCQGNAEVFLSVL